MSFSTAGTAQGTLIDLDELGGVVVGEAVPPSSGEQFRAAEFFAGIGLVRMAIEKAGFQVVWANDIDKRKLRLYQANFGSEEFHLEDIRSVTGESVPTVDLATASFPCTDLSLAGNRAGLAGEQSGLFWELARVLEEMGARKPSTVLIENVVAFASSHGGGDLAAAIGRLNELGYWCDLLVVDAKHFVPQSRPRLFIVGSAVDVDPTSSWQPSQVRPRWISEFVSSFPHLDMRPMAVTLPPPSSKTLGDIVERFDPTDSIWWPDERRKAFSNSLSSLHAERLQQLVESTGLTWRTAYRRTRNGKAVWEIREDDIAGCLRTARGGSSKQAVVEAGNGHMRVRWMTAAEYARLQGAGPYRIEGVTPAQAMFGFGDAVCVPVVEWLATEYLRPLATIAR